MLIASYTVAAPTGVNKMITASAIVTKPPFLYDISSFLNCFNFVTLTATVTFSSAIYPTQCSVFFAPSLFFSILSLLPTSSIFLAFLMVYSLSSGRSLSKFYPCQFQTLLIRSALTGPSFASVCQISISAV